MMRISTCLAFLAAAALAAGCSGIPVRSVPRLLQLQSELPDMNPAEFRVALQVDARFVPPPGAVPLLSIRMTPREAGAFEPIDKNLPLQLAVVSTATLGLAAPPPGRRWLIYSMPAATQLELQHVQGIMRRAKAMPHGKGGGSISLGVKQDSLAVTEPALAHTRWETWLQTKQRDGFFEAWTGTAGQLGQLTSTKR